MNNKFSIGDKVYHVTPDSLQGVILDIRYYFRTGMHEYYVSWNFNTSNYCIEEELSYNKTII